MRKFVFASAVALSLFLASPASAQVSVVERAKSDLLASGFDANRDAACVDFEIVKIVVGRIPGAGLLQKDCCGDFTDPNRTHCLGPDGNGYSHDIVAFSNGTIVDVAIGDGHNTPSWQVADPDPALVARYHSATSLGLFGVVPGAVGVPTPAPIPTPTPAPLPTVPATDYTPLLQQILESQQRLLDAQAALLDVSKDTNTHVVNIDHTFTQTLGHFSAFVGKYIAPAIGGFIAAHQLGK